MHSMYRHQGFVLGGLHCVEGARDEDLDGETTGHRESSRSQHAPSTDT
jgi:hypothetical protein